MLQDSAETDVDEIESEVDYGLNLICEAVQQLSVCLQKNHSGDVSELPEFIIDSVVSPGAASELNGVDAADLMEGLKLYVSIEDTPETLNAIILEELQSMTVQSEVIKTDEGDVDADENVVVLTDKRTSA